MFRREILVALLKKETSNPKAAHMLWNSLVKMYSIVFKPKSYQEGGGKGCWAENKAKYPGKESLYFWSLLHSHTLVVPQWRLKLETACARPVDCAMPPACVLGATGSVLQEGEGAWEHCGVRASPYPPRGWCLQHNQMATLGFSWDVLVLDQGAEGTGMHLAQNPASS